MSRNRDSHPLGKVSQGKRHEVQLPDPLNHRLEVIAAIYGKTPTAWLRDLVEKEVEGEWVFIQRRRRLSAGDDDDNGMNSRGMPGT